MISKVNHNFRLILYYYFIQKF